MVRSQATLPTTPMVTLRNPAPGHIMLGQQRVQLKELQPSEDNSLMTPSVCARVCHFWGVTCSMYCNSVFLPVPVRLEVPPVSKQVCAAAFTPAQKNKLKEAGGTFK